MSQYKDFDDALIVCIDLGHNTMAKMEPLITLKGMTDAMNLRDDRGSRVPHFRVIDRRLQALRKAGRIIYQDKRWSISQ
jgi:hypothetical protein